MGCIEPFDQTQSILSTTNNVHTQMFNDHSHYLIPGGENYTKGFTAFDVYRGQEGDPVGYDQSRNIRMCHRRLQRGMLEAKTKSLRYRV